MAIRVEDSQNEGKLNTKERNANFAIKNRWMEGDWRGAES